MYVELERKQKWEGESVNKQDKKRIRQIKRETGVRTIVGLSAKI